MSRYEWPARPPRRRGRAIQRRAYLQGRDAGMSGARDEEEAGREPGVAGLAAHAPGRPGERLARLAPGVGGGPRWVPLGPVGTLRGSGDSDPRVAGRVRDLAVSPDGQRLYAASALGGLWYSGDAGVTWEPVAPFATTRGADATRASTTLSCGAVHVRFDAGGDVSADEVVLATGEPDPGTQQPFDAGVVARYGGVGILTATGPVQDTRDDVGVDPWTREAQPDGAYPGLRGQGVFALAEDPAVPGAMVAATTRGLHRRDPAAVGEPWAVVTVAAWEALVAGVSATAVVTDAVWTAVGAGSRLWVAVAGPAVPQQVRGLWRSDAGPAGPFVRVELPGTTTAAGRRTLRRLTLAVAPSDPEVLYVLGNRTAASGARLWRVDGAVGRRVTGVPSLLFGDAAGDQSEYDMALAVDPGEPLRVMVGGSAVTSSVDTAMPAASLYRLTLRTPAPTGAASWRTDYTGGHAGHATWVGAEIHPDVHRLRWVRPGGVPPGVVLVCCDGGVWHSASDGDRFGFTSRAAGLAVTEPGFVASHPLSPGVVLAGVQDNGVQLRIGESVWRRALANGDGGGVTFDPGRGDRFLGQAFGTSWTTQDDQSADVTWRGFANGAQATESAVARFYSNVASFRRANGRTQTVIGTNRVWYSENWFANRVDAVANVIRVDAVTLPSFGDPRAADAQDTATDVLPTGPLPADSADRSTGVRVLRWAGEHRLYALMPGAVHRLDRTAGTGVWRRTQIHRRTAAGPVIPVAPGPALPREGSLNDLAVHDAARGPHGSFYLATSHPTEPVWWFDGTGTWHPCLLGDPNGGDVRASAYAVVVDPANPGTVWAGTALGIFEGTLDLTGVAPVWTWGTFSDGLPEAAVQDLVLDTWPTPGGGQVRLLRAALQARGLWEAELDVPFDEVTYLRAHPYDTRRILPVPTADPLRGPGADRAWHLDWAAVRNSDFRTAAGLPAPHPDGSPERDLGWHASPDIRVRPHPTAANPAAPASLPWTRLPEDRWALWALQTALHSIDERVVPDGRWTAVFARRLRQIRVARGLSDQARVDAGLWDDAVVQSGFFADPWADGGPTESDLVERLVGLATPRIGAVTAAAVSPASVAVPAVRSLVHVCVHHRGLDPRPAADVTVFLLTLPLPADPATWAGVPVPPMPGTVPSATLAIGSPAGDLDAARPAVVTLDVDFSAHAPGTRLLLLALVQAGAGTPVLAGGSIAGPGLRDLVLGSPHVAARSVEVVAMP